MKTMQTKYVPNFNIGASKLVTRHMKNTNPTNWDGNGEMPKGFYCQPVDYSIDIGHKIRIHNTQMMTGSEKWYVVVEYVVCGMVSARDWAPLEDLVNGIENLCDIVTGIYDNKSLYLEAFDKSSELEIVDFKPVPMGEVVKYEERRTLVDMSAEAVTAYNILMSQYLDDIGFDKRILKSELLDVWFFGGDVDMHIALTINSISAKILPKIREWANKYAGGMTFDTYAHYLANMYESGIK